MCDAQCASQLAKASDTQAVDTGSCIVLTIKIGLRILFKIDLILLCINN